MLQELGPYLKDKTHVIWDWNGTLLSDLDHAVATVNRLLREENLKPTTVDDYKRQFGFPVIRYYELLGFDTSPDSFASLCSRFNDYFYSGLHQCELWPGALETLQAIRQSGRKQSLLSASEQTMLNESTRRFGVSDLFHHVVGIDNIQADSKVHRGHELMKLAGEAIEQTVLIGDTDHDLEVAKALGIEAVLVEHGHQCPTRLRAVHPTVVRLF